jgi:hypothetical protein
MSDPSSIGGTVLTTPLDGSVTSAKLASNVAYLLGSATNLCLNPGFETILPGTHTSAIKTLSTSGTLNLLVPAWQSSSGGNSITVDTSSTVTGKSKKSISVTVGGTGTKVQQVWNSSQFLDSYVASMIGSYFTFSVDVKLSSSTSSAARLFVTYNGSGGTTAFSSYHGANQNWERLFVQTSSIPSDCTDITFGIQFDIPRGPINLKYLVEGTNTAVVSGTTPKASWTSCNASWSTITWALNSVRPAWCTSILINGYVVESGTGQTQCFLRTKGVSGNSVLTGFQSYIENTAIRGWAIVNIGTDGLFEIYIDAAGSITDFALYHHSNYGEGL